MSREVEAGADCAVIVFAAGLLRRQQLRGVHRLANSGHIRSNSDAVDMDVPEGNSKLEG